MSTTLKDIALAAGVSIGTVDRALNNRGRINTETAQRIKDLAKEMDYHKNKFASSLVKRTGHYKIAIILHILGNDFFDDILAGIQKAVLEFHDYGISTEIYPCKDFDAVTQFSNIESAINNGANAMVIVPINAPIIQNKVNQLCSEGFPIVFLISFLKNIPVISSVHSDHYRSGRIAGRLSQLIFNKNNHMIAFFPPSLMLGNDLRKEGFENYFASHPSSLKVIKIIELTNNYDVDYNLIYDTLTQSKDVNQVLFYGNAKTVLSAISHVNRPINCISFDFSKEIESALKDGIITATITQNPIEEGYQSIYILFQYLVAKKSPPKTVLTKNEIILKECFDDNSD